MTAEAGDADGLRVTVLGGTGFVGSRVCKLLSERGASVTSVSRTGTAPAWCVEEEWSSSVTWRAADLLGPDPAAIDDAVGRPVAVVSCVGVVGADRDDLLRGNGDANVAGFASAERGGAVTRAALVSVSSEVSACEGTWLPDFFGGYFEGKRVAERAASDVVDGDACVVRPSFIYGGDAFGLLPPRVNDAYGSGVEELLSLGPIRFLADVAPGLIKVALRPPSSVDAVAAACAGAALGEVSGILDGTDAINEAAGQPEATGLTEALEWTGEKLTDAFNWAKVEVPKAIEWTKTKIDDANKN